MRGVVVAAALVVIPSALIGARLFTQQWALLGPAGGSATIEGTTIRAASRVGARLLERPVREGDRVEAGQLLARLDCAEPDAVLAEARARLSAAIAQAEAATVQARTASLQTRSASVASRAAAAQAEALAAQRDAAARQASRVKALDDGTSPALLDQSASSADALLHQSAAAAAQAEGAAVQIGLARGQADAAAQNASAAAEAVHAAEAAVRRAELMVAECVLLAPRAGVVETLPFEVGEIVPPGQPLALLVDATTVTATFWLPNAELGDAAVGQAATLEADAWPGREFRGTVTRIGAEAAFTPRNVQTRTDRDRLVYPVEVTVENADLTLHPGMPVQIALVDE
jgi:HlyD family secretion protein